MSEASCFAQRSRRSDSLDLTHLTRDPVVCESACGFNLYSFRGEGSVRGSVGGAASGMDDGGAQVFGGAQLLSSAAASLSPQSTSRTQHRSEDVMPAHKIPPQVSQISSFSAKSLGASKSLVSAGLIFEVDNELNLELNLHPLLKTLAHCLLRDSC